MVTEKNAAKDDGKNKKFTSLPESPLEVQLGLLLQVIIVSPKLLRPDIFSKDAHNFSVSHSVVAQSWKKKSKYSHLESWKQYFGIFA